VSGDARDDLYQVAALLDELERVLNPLAIEERGELVSTPSVPPALPQAPRGGGAGNAGRGPSSPGPGQSRRSFDAERGIERVRMQPGRAMQERSEITPAPRRAPPPPGAPRMMPTPPSSSAEAAERAVGRERAASPVIRHAAEVRPDVPTVRGTSRAPAVADEAVVDAPVATVAVHEARARRVLPAAADIAPEIPRARIATPQPPARVEAPVLPAAAPERAPAARREAPAAPGRRSHARARLPRATNASTPVDRADAPSLPGERAAIRRSPAAPADHRSDVPLRKTQTRRTERGRRVPVPGARLFELPYEVSDRNDTAPPLPRRARERSGPLPTPSMPPPEVIDPFETAPMFEDDEREPDDATVIAPPSKIWLRGGRLRWAAGPAQLARADRALSRLVRKRGRRL
jgi:hypothetical protein